MAVLQSIVDERRNQSMDDSLGRKKDMMDQLLSVKDENGKKLEDEEIVDVLLMYLNAGHESSGHTMMWATIFLQEHPEFLEKAKVYISISIVFSCLSSGFSLYFYWMT